jgi:hypothetical protein
MSSAHYGSMAGEIADEGRPREPAPEELAEPCDSCTCCTRLGCYRGPDSDCPYSESAMAYLCPCTED